jgi:uncharacterized phage-associated protein
MVSANEVASVILSRSGQWLDAMTLQKLLYYVQAWHLAVTDEPVFSDRFKAWRDGPVVPQVWHERRERHTRRPELQNEVQLDEVTSDIVDAVLAAYGSMSGDQLSALTHVEQPWVAARGDLPADAHSQTPIDEDVMASFYRANRLLGGRRAADLAAGGVFLRRQATTEAPVDVEALLREIPDHIPDVDAWGGANLRGSVPTFHETPDA